MTFDEDDDFVIDSPIAMFSVFSEIPEKVR